MGCTRIMTDNFLDPDVVSNATVSSEQTAFPVSNLYNAQRRSKVWRSNGYWEIISGDNTIIFRESVGVDLTATVAAGSYTSNTTFFAALKTAFEDAGASTYTISLETGTNKIKITSNGAGGGGILQLMWTDAGSTDMAGVLGYDTASNDTGALTYTADQLRIGTEEWIKWDMGISSNPKAFILIGARNSAIKITPSAVLKLQGNETDVWTSPSYESTLTYNDNNISVFSETGLHTEELRFWRLYVEDLSNPQGYVEIGSLFLGDFFQATRGAVQFPFRGSYIDRSPTIFSEGGQTFSDIREKSESFDIEWSGLTVAEKESIDDHFNDYGTGVPFFISFDPNAAFSSDSHIYIRYVKFESAPSYTLVSPGNFSCTMSLREEL